MAEAMTPARRAEIERLLADFDSCIAGARLGPGMRPGAYVDPERDWIVVNAGDECGDDVQRLRCREEGEARFIAGALNDVPALVAIVRELLGREALGPDLTMTVECSTCEGSGTEIVTTEDRGRVGILCEACTGTGRVP